jgi:hypothetical protein
LLLTDSVKIAGHLPAPQFESIGVF